MHMKAGKQLFFPASLCRTERDIGRPRVARSDLRYWPDKPRKEGGEGAGRGRGKGGEVFLTTASDGLESF